MTHFNRIYFLIVVLLFVGLACAGVPVLIPDTGAVSTSAAETVIAGFTQTHEILSATVEVVSTMLPTLTQTETPTPTQTLTATEAFTPTPLVPLISVSVPTNCRNGPGKVYDMVGALLVDKFVEVYGRDPTSNYWYIRNPDANTEYCWVWGKYATFIGPVLLVPVYTPPPTPTPTFTPSPTATPTPFSAFKAEYTNMDSCNGSWWVEVKLKNTGSLPLKSVDVSAKDITTGTVFENLADGFINMDGCLAKTTKDVLGSGDTYLLSAPAFNYDLTGHEVKVTVTLCSETGQKGACVTRKVEFIP
jgi:hypothetical protein